MIVNFDIGNEELEYIAKCARIRQCTVSRLLSRVLHHVCEDQLVLAVLDDDSKPNHQKGEHRHHYIPPRKVGSVMHG